MASLRLLTENYASSSLSSSPSSDEESTQQGKRKKQQDNTTRHKKTNSSNREDEQREPLPMLPSIKNLYGPEPDNQHEDASLHQGRARSFPHEVGSWSTFVYVPFTPDPVFLDLVALLTKKCTSLSMTATDDFHISVSRTVVLRYHWIAGMVSSLKKALGSSKSFVVALNCIEVYCNEEKTRTFLGLKVIVGVASLKQIVHTVDELFADFKLPSFYKFPSFHMSIGWCLGDRSHDLELLIPQLQLECERFVLNSEECRTTVVKGIALKTGNKTFSIPFQT